MPAIAVVDLGFGDAGKGLVVDWLARAWGARLAVRFNGGAQAGHNVVTSDGRHHTFSQIGAGSFVPGVRTHLASRVVVHPTALLLEAQHLAAVGAGDALARLTVSGDAPVVTPFHQAACRVRELARGGGRHGSCGVGVGEVMRDSLASGGDHVRARDLGDRATLVRRLTRVRERVRNEVGDARERAIESDEGARELGVLDDAATIEAWIDATRPFVARVALASDDVVHDALAGGERVVFEGAQGVLLDEDWGFHPYTTWSRCTFANVDDLFAGAGGGEPVLRLGVARVYAHRHGPGPLPTELHTFRTAPLSGLAEPHNGDGRWQGPFRIGWPDLVMARYARAVCGGIDALALTHIDALARCPEWRIARSYAEPDEDAAPHARQRAEPDTDAAPHARIVEWPRQPPSDLDARADATQRLMAARAALDAVRPGDVEEALCESYGARLALRSRGPTAADVESMREWP
jgi:adenylosuccinate synthase